MKKLLELLKKCAIFKIVKKSNIMAKQTNFIDSIDSDFKKRISEFADSAQNLKLVSENSNFFSIADYLAILQSRLTSLKKDFKRVTGKDITKY